MGTNDQIDLSDSELRRYVTEITDRTSSDGELFKGLVRAHLLTGDAAVLDVLQELLEEASAVHEKESLQPDHGKIAVFWQWIRQRAWITACLTDAIAQAPPRMKAAGDRVIQHIDERTSSLRGDVAAATFKAGTERDIVVAPTSAEWKK